MSVDASTVAKVARLARIAVTPEEAVRLEDELNAIFGLVDELAQVDVEGVEPMTSAVALGMRMRRDVITDGGIADKVLANAPLSEDDYYLVPKVVE
ncbi:aspartyl/glutamyl-tRNA(Asn/Gln) amidotransferase subunit C [Pseudoxanthobacter soli DSM 19599]|uniref:Aspartyl/glutamyl-tRNA(Asn/Gln) amidotransferase subunit C n=1 Tax=Pseudoxanthobacter soli DSM 19599 TaxID=1123029 RepID=A0A1M7ZQ96_9HYPH|nr:Asp-tRNA(Asn)/Glu-tRNA(Gln) amidotransferase subunit GatC [Pseudoxanthobacter soli]SHO67047.1 aspartyl/glutamyl-tRNA(Asn/Gln) amidotransferase subunit C [Pseudoxanthobacter soli DSM 19599]